MWCMARPRLKLEYNVQGVDNTLREMLVDCKWQLVDSGTHRNVTKNGQQDVDEEVGIATALEEDT